MAVSLWTAARLLPQAPELDGVPEPAAEARSIKRTGMGADDAGTASGSDISLESGRTAVSSLPEPHPLSDALCPAGMSWVEGEFCPAGSLKSSAPSGCSVSTRALGVCMDRHEYPAQPGVRPAVMLNFYDARRVCRAEGKRLCTESEWTLACRETVSPAACNFGQTTRKVAVAELWDVRKVSTELAAHDGRRPSAESACVSQFSVFDMLGNVQEWVTSEHPSGYEGALKGGRYNQSSIGCERSIQTRQPLARLPHTGARCCADPLVQLPGGR